MVVYLLGGLPFGGLRLGVIGIHEFEACPDLICKKTSS